MRFPPVAEPARASRRQAQWVWLPQPEAPTAYLRWVLDLPAAPERAWLSVGADNVFELYANGKRLAGAEGWRPTTRVDLAGHLRPGADVFSIAAQNLGGPGGAVAQGEVLLPHGRRIPIATGRHWRVSLAAPEGWREPGFDDSGWAAAQEYGVPPCDPWGDLGTAGAR